MDDPIDGPTGPYVFREAAETGAQDSDDPGERPPDPEGREVVIVDGRAMSYRTYRR
jgi:hypothetical protein